METEKIDTDEDEVKQRLKQLKASINPADIRKSGIKPKELQLRIEEAEDRLRGDVQFESAVKRLTQIAKKNIQLSKKSAGLNSKKTSKPSRKGNKT